MYDRLVKKMKSHFGEESLIIYSKHCDFYQINPIKKDDVQIYYDYFMTEQIPKNQFVLNDIACCLYYLSSWNKEYKDKFTKQIVQKIDVTDQKNDDFMILIYNIIEFDKIYLEYDKNQIEYLLFYLERFSTTVKNKTNFLLFKYYRGWLKYRLNDIQTANLEYLEFVSAYSENIVHQNMENKYTLFLKLQSDLLNVKLLNYSQGDDIWQSRIFLKDLYDQTKILNEFLAIRIGFELYDIYLQENNYHECIDILMNMRTTLKKKFLKGYKMNNAIDFYLAIVCRLGYVGVLINNKASIESSLKKLKKSIDMFDKHTEQNKEKIAIFKNAYSFLYVIIKINSREKVDEDLQKKIAGNFKSYFLPDLKQFEQKKSGGKFIVNKNNFFNFVVNLEIINNIDYDVETFWTNEVYKPLMLTVEKNNPLQQNCVMTFVFSVHYQIKKFCQSYCQAEDDMEKMKYKNGIVDLAQKILNYINMYGIDDRLFRTQLIKGAIVDIVSAYAHVLIYNKEFIQLKGLIQAIDSMEKNFGMNDNTPSYELICKVKGDFWLLSKQRDTKAAIMLYEKGYKLLESNHPKKPILLFNIAYCHFVNKDKNNALEYLNRCVHEFNNISQKNIAPDFYYRPNAIGKKIALAKKMINILNTNK